MTKSEMESKMEWLNQSYVKLLDVISTLYLPDEMGVISARCVVCHGSVEVAGLRHEDFYVGSSEKLNVLTLILRCTQCGWEPDPILACCERRDKVIEGKELVKKQIDELKSLIEKKGKKNATTQS